MRLLPRDANISDGMIDVAVWKRAPLVSNAAADDGAFPEDYKILGIYR